MKQLRKTEWRRGYPIKKFLALCVWGVMAIAGCAGTLSCPDNIPSLAACVLALAGAVLTLPRLLRYYRTTYHSLPALNRHHCGGQILLKVSTGSGSMEDIFRKNSRFWEEPK